MMTMVIGAGKIPSKLVADQLIFELRNVLIQD